MANILHIVNGDCTAEMLKQTTLKGDVLVWRELLCEGPVCKEFGSDEFWKMRYAFFEKELKVSKLEYFDKTIKEIVQLEDLEGYTEVVLWFEFDLFCQVNLMALCKYLLASFRKDINYKLVCTGFVKGEKRLQSLADVKIENFTKLYENALNISKRNLEFSEACWEVYASNNVKKLKEFNFSKQRNKFQYYKIAIDQHLKRFPEEGKLNEIDTKLIQVISANSFTNNEIIKEMLCWQQENTVYGFGDLQYFQYLKKLNNYYTITNSKYSLNAKGKALLH